MSKDRWWLRYYLSFSPIGALIIAVVIAGAVKAWPPWGSRGDLELFGALVTLGLACYGAGIWILELVGVALLRAWSEYKNWRNTDRKNTRKEFLLDLVAAGLVDLSSLTQEELRKLGLEEQDLQELRDKELASL